MGTDRIDRTKRVKEARDEAKKEIDEYKKAKEEEFKKFESEVRSLYHLSTKFMMCWTVLGCWSGLSD